MLVLIFIVRAEVSSKERNCTLLGPNRPEIADTPLAYLAPLKANKTKINALSLCLLYELGSVIHVLFVYFRKSEPVRKRFEIEGGGGGLAGVNKFTFRFTYKEHIHERKV